MHNFSPLVLVKPEGACDHGLNMQDIQGPRRPCEKQIWKSFHRETDLVGDPVVDLQRQLLGALRVGVQHAPCGATPRATGKLGTPQNQTGGYSCKRAYGHSLKRGFQNELPTKMFDRFFGGNLC